MKKFCPYPFNRAHISSSGEVYACCIAWQGISLGNVFNKDFEEIWNSKSARSIRESVLDGSFRFCRSDICPRIVSGQVTRDSVPESLKTAVTKNRWFMERGPSHLSLNYDDSCNLACRSCRDRLKVRSRDDTDRLIRFQDSLLASEFFKNVRRVVVTGAGEPFSSRVFMDFFQKINQFRYPRLKITLRSNGLLLTAETWGRIKNVHYAIDAILISLDAATERTYLKIRQGSDFKKVLANLKFLKDMKKRKKFKLGLNFVVQLQNFQEMVRFVKLGKSFNCDEVTFTKLLKQGALTSDEYNKMAIHKPDHPQFRKLKRIVRHSIFKDPMVSLNNLSFLG